jgi:subtilase family serine protease
MGEVDEISELNNDSSADFTCWAALPDLEVDRIALDDDNCKAGQNRVRVTVRNNGSAPAEHFLVRLFVNGAEVADRDIDDIPAGDKQRIRFNGVALGAGQQSLRVQTDVRNAVTESNEGNNSLAVGFTCAGETRSGR